MFSTGKLASLLLAAVVLLAVASSAPAQDKVTVKLEPQNNSGESGTATLTPSGDSTKVVLDVKGAKGNQPTHIHKGSCAQLDPKPAFPLSPLVNGKSESTVKASVKDLTSGSYAINGHKSSDDLKTYVFCGDIKAGM
jgi:hypothetical protein